MISAMLGRNISFTKPLRAIWCSDIFTDKRPPFSVTVGFTIKLELVTYGIYIHIRYENNCEVFLAKLLYFDRQKFS